MRKINDVVRENIIKLYDSNFTVKEIAKINGCSQSYVYILWKNNGLSKRQTDLQKKIAKLRKQGKVCTEIADTLKIDTGRVKYNARVIGLDFSKNEKEKSYNIGKEKAKFNQYGSTKEREQKQLNFISLYYPEFEYINGWLNGDGSIEFKCKKCGFVFHKSAVTIRHKRKSYCPKCIELEKEIKEKAKKEKTQEKIRYSEYVKEQRFWTQNFKQIEMQKCSYCGGFFVGKNKKYCSTNCAKKYQDTIKKDKRIKRIKKSECDLSISLQALYKRDKGVCWLCGEKCDFSDYKIDNNNFIVGKNYPSIDHVMPLSKNGKHTWSNVKLAHHYCNTLKRDKVVGYD